MRSTLLVLLLLQLGTSLAHAVDLYEEARRAIRAEIPQMDMSGISVRGGTNFATGQAAQSGTLFRGQSEIGGTCGRFDFRGSMRQAFEEIPDMLTALVMDIGYQIPMLAVCYLEQTLCDSFKHWQGVLNGFINAKYAQCQSIQNAMAYAGLRLRDGATSQCLEHAANRGLALPAAMKECTDDLATIRRPDGTEGTETHLIREVLARGGATEETQTVANALFGEIIIRTGDGRLRTQTHQPQAAVLGFYEAHRADAETGLRAAVQEQRETGRVSDETLRSASVPGQATPRVIVEALTHLEADPTRYETAIGQFATEQAMIRLTWQMQDLENELVASMENNAELTTEARRGIEKRIEMGRRALVQMQEKVAAAKKLQPVFDEVLRQYTAMQQVAVQAGIHMPMLTNQPGAYGRQTPIGYNQ